MVSASAAKAGLKCGGDRSGEPLRHPKAVSESSWLRAIWRSGAFTGAKAHSRFHQTDAALKGRSSAVLHESFSLASPARGWEVRKLKIRVLATKNLRP
jgi:hypothetical protein